MSRRDRAIPHGDIPFPVEIEDVAPDMDEFTEIVNSVTFAATKTLTAARTFDQMIRGEKVLADPLDPYWENQLKAGNVYVAREDTE